MVTWQETVNEHGLWAALRQVRDLCQSEGWPDDEDVRDVVSRAIWLCSHVEARKDTNCLTTNSLDAARDAMQAIGTRLAGLRADPPTATTEDVRAGVDQVLVAIVAWPRPDEAEMYRAAAADVEQHHKMANDALEALRSAVADTRNQIETQIVQWQADAAAQIEAASDLNTNLQTNVAAATTELATQRQRLDTALNDFVAKSQAAEKERDTAEVAAVQSREQSAKEQLDAQQETGKDILEKMGDLLKQGRETLHTIGKEASASYYGTYADQQRSAAFRWSIVVLVSLAAAAAFLVWAAIEHADTWHSATARYALGVIFVGTATYAGSQSSLHRELERKSRQRELAIGALGSFLSDVRSDNVSDLKLGVAAELFIDNGKPESSQAGYQTPGAQIVSAVRNIFGKRAEPPKD